jgi:hypothetical protein
MTDINPPVLESKQIIKASLSALVIGTALFVIAVLPAEYGIDPTGAGRLLGLSKLYQPEEPQTAVVSVSGAQTAKALRLEELGSGPDVPLPKEASNPAPSQQLAERQDSVTIKVPAGEGLEYKLNMLKYGQVKYEWITDQGVLFFDFHGEVKEENPADETFFESYTVANSANMIGTFLAPFEGRHGWYFKNNTNKDIVVSLRVKGQYLLD